MRNNNINVSIITATGCLLICLSIMNGCGTVSTSDGTLPPTTITVTETRSGTDIIANNKIIYLYFRPLTSTNEVIIKKNNSLVTWEVDYVIPTVESATVTVIPSCELAYVNDPADISDGLITGTIKYLGPLSGSDTLEVTYTYKKWTAGRFSGSGNSGTLQYIITGETRLVPGGETVSIYAKSDPYCMTRNLTRNTTKEGYDKHYRINYTDPPYIRFNSDPIVVEGITYYINDINFTVITRKY